MLIQDAITEFVHSREAMACTPATLHTYTAELTRLFSRYLGMEGVTQAEQLTPSVIIGYLAWSRDRGVGGVTLRSMRTRVGTFVTWCGAMDYCQKGVMDAVPRPRAGEFIRKTHTQEEIRRLLQTAADPYLFHPFDGQELTATLLLLLDTGLRAGEVIRLNVGDLEGDGLIKVRGKGNKERYVMVSELTRKAIDTYLSLRPFARPEDALFINRGYGVNYHRRGGRITDRALYQRIMRLGRAAGVKTFPHMWRHTFAAMAVRNGANLKALQLFLGHSDLATTDNYLKGFGFEDAAREHKVFSPVQAMMSH